VNGFTKKTAPDTVPFFIDTHCHLDATEFDADRDAEYARAVAAGVGIQVVPAVSRDNFAAVAAACTRYPGCLPAWGLHPMYISVHRPEHLADLRAQIGARRPVAVGEIGLDLFVRGLDRATQEYFFVEQLKIARDHDLPVLLHCRRANDELLKQLRRIRVRGGMRMPSTAVRNRRTNSSSWDSNSVLVAPSPGLAPTTCDDWRSICRSTPSCWKPTVPTSRRHGSDTAATRRASCRASRKRWPSCAGWISRRWPGPPPATRGRSSAWRKTRVRRAGQPA